MKMNKEVRKFLNVLGFPEDNLPKMKELRKRYFELSLVRHPDKKNGTDEAFQELLNAYHEIGKLIENTVDTDGDVEEDAARKAFKESNVEKINKTSVTVKILTSHVSAWDMVFTEKYGNPIDDTPTTKQWHVPYTINEDAFGVIKVKI